MKITRVLLLPDAETYIDFNISELGNPSPYQVKAILGLDAVEIVPRFYGESVDRSSAFYDLILPSREIIIRAGLRPDLRNQLSASDLRDMLYRSIARNRTGVVKLIFMNGSTDVLQTAGRIVKMEVPHFSKETEAQLTIECVDPSFYGTSVQTVVDPPSGVDDTQRRFMLLEDEESTAPHGMLLEVEVMADCDRVWVGDQNTTWQFEIDARIPFVVDNIEQQGFKTGDLIQISSEVGNRMLKFTLPRFTSAGSTIMGADRIGRTSIWPTMFPGENLFAVRCTRGGALVEPPQYRAASWYSRFWGV